MRGGLHQNSRDKAGASPLGSCPQRRPDATHVKHVAEVEPDSAHLHLDVVRARSSARGLLPREAVNTGAIGLCESVGVRPAQAGACDQSRWQVSRFGFSKSWGERAMATDRDFCLVGRGQQNLGQRLDRGVIGCLNIEQPNANLG